MFEIQAALFHTQKVRNRYKKYYNIKSDAMIKRLIIFSILFFSVAVSLSHTFEFSTNNSEDLTVRAAVQPSSFSGYGTACNQEYGQEPDTFINGSQNFVADPINIFNGNLVEAQTDIRFPSPFEDGLVFKRYYNSRSADDSAIGFGWVHNYSSVLTPDFNGSPKLIRIVDSTGRGYYFEDYDTDGIFMGAFSENSTITTGAGGNYVWTRDDGSVYIFDVSDGKFLSVTDKNGNQQILAYDASNRLASVTDAATGRELTFYYNADDKIDHINGPVTASVPQTSVTGETGGTWASFQYDTSGNLTRATYADEENGSVASGFTYLYEDANDVHNMTGRKDLEGHLLSSWTYDIEDRAVSNTNTQGTGATIDYTNPLAVKTTDDYGIERTYHIGEIQGRKKILEKTRSGSCSTCSEGIKKTDFDTATGYPIRREYFNGRIDLYQNYDSANNPQTQVISQGTSEERTIYKTYHPVLSTPLTITEKSLLADTEHPDRVRKTIFDYDDPSAAGDTPESNENPSTRIYRIIEQGYTLDASQTVVAFEHIISLTYNTSGQILSMNGPFDGTGDTFQYTYDTSGNLTSIINPVSGTTQFQNYDDAGNPGRVIDVRGVATDLTYDGWNRLLTFDTDGETVSREYTAAGLVKSLTDGAGRTLQYGYNTNHGLPETITNSAGETISYAYDINYNLISQTLRNDQGTSTWYLGKDYGDPAGNTGLAPGEPWKTIVRNQTDTENLETEYEYTNGNLTKATGPSGAWTEYQYDTLNRVIQTTEKINDTQNAATTYAYDALNNLIRITDANNNSTLYTHDDAGRLVKEVSPDTGTTLYAYDDAGKIKTLKANDGRTVQYLYDSQYRLTDTRYVDIAQNITYVYDQETVSGKATNGKGKLTTVIDPSGTNIFRYDFLDRITATEKITGARTFTTSYTHDNGGLLSTVTYPSGRIVTYSRNGSGYITSVTTTYNDITHTLADNITHAPFGPVKNKGFSNGKTETREFDLQYRPGFIRVQGITDLSYTYSSAGNISGVTNSITGPGSFKPVVSRDDVETYQYKTGTNKIDTITGSISSTVFGHDDNGNITAKGNLTFEYFQDNRLSAVRDAGALISTYEYNSFGQRTRKTVGDLITLFHYDLQGNLICESAQDGTVLKEYIYLNTLPLALIVHGAETKTYFYHTNHLGTPIALTNDAGQIAWKASHGPFGKVNISVSTLENNLRFPGQYFDGETGLHYNWHRYYDSDIGRYLTPDPIGLAGGINPFVYAESNPTNYIDPNGLSALWMVNPAIGSGLGVGVVENNNQATVSDYIQAIEFLWSSSWLNPQLRAKSFLALSHYIEGPKDPTNPNDWLDWGKEHDQKVSEDTLCEERTPWEGPGDGWDPDKPPPPDPKDPLWKKIVRLLMDTIRIGNNL